MEKRKKKSSEKKLINVEYAYTRDDNDRIVFSF